MYINLYGYNNINVYINIYREKEREREGGERERAKVHWMSGGLWRWEGGMQLRHSVGFDVSGGRRPLHRQGALCRRAKQTI